MYSTLVAALAEAAADPQVRVVVLSGAGGAFTAGNDLEDFMHHPPASADSPVYQFLWQLSHAGKPIIAAVAGAAVGIGTTMLLHCDLVYADTTARFSMPFVQLGLCPEAASSLLLPQLAGYHRAAEKLLLGEAFFAEEALQIGLVNQVLEADQLMPFARAQASKLVALPAASLRATKRLLKSTQLAAIDAQMAAESQSFGAMLAAPEAKEAFAAFFDKRKPDFSQFS